MKYPKNKIEMVKIMRTIRKVLCAIVATVAAVVSANAVTTIKDTVTIADGFVIPISIMIPDGQGPFPVYFNVHGGGWLGGTKTEVPAASLAPAASEMCDNLGIVMVGLGYRCMDQNGNFDKAMADVMESYQWVKERAKRFKCDFSNVGFSGGSAGTPISALAAQLIPECSVYVGINGIYDFTALSERTFANANNNKRAKFEKERAVRYKLYTPEEKHKASAIFFLKENPPASLFIHGDADKTIEYTQSVNFAKAINKQGGEAFVVIHPQVGHAFYKIWNPDLYRKSTEAVMEHLIKYFKLQNPNREGVKKAVEKSLSTTKNKKKVTKGA